MVPSLNASGFFRPTGTPTFCSDLFATENKTDSAHVTRLTLKQGTASATAAGNVHRLLFHINPGRVGNVAQRNCGRIVFLNECRGRLRRRQSDARKRGAGGYGMQNK